MDQHAGERLHDRGRTAAAALSRRGDGLERRDGNVADPDHEHHYYVHHGTSVRLEDYHLLWGLWIYRHTDGGCQSRFGPIPGLGV